MLRPRMAIIECNEFDYCLLMSQILSQGTVLACMRLAFITQTSKERYVFEAITQLPTNSLRRAYVCDFSMGAEEDYDSTMAEDGYNIRRCQVRGR